MESSNQEEFYTKALDFMHGFLNNVSAIKHSIEDMAANIEAIKHQLEGIDGSLNDMANKDKAFDEFFLCYSTNPEDLMKEIETYIAKGWEPYGNPFVQGDQIFQGIVYKKED